MTPDTALASLNRVLDQVGEDAVLGRPATPTTPAKFSVQLDVRAFVRPIRGVVGTVQVVLSPRDLATWGRLTGGNVGDPNLPRITDKMVIQGRLRAIKDVHTFYMDGQLVRVEIEATA